MLKRLHWTPGIALAVAAALVAMAGGVAVAASGAGLATATPAERPAALAARAETAVLLDATQAGARLVAVGERGLVLLSDDAGKTWRQAASPTSVTLTAVRFASPTHGWATGHAGVILATDDAGEHWRKQLDGRAAAASALAQARSATGADPAVRKATENAQRLVDDGPDKPFFDIWFADAMHGFAVGAYNLFMRTDDGGATWTAAMDRLPNPKGNHLYAIGGSGAQLFIVGEQGLILRSTDGGKHFEALKSPYNGSFFRMAALPDGALIVAGLRGNAFRSVDGGESWGRLNGMPPVSWVASSVAADGTVWLGNQASQVFASHDSGATWLPVAAPPGPPTAPLTGLLALGDQGALTTTVRGLGHVSAASGAR